jgi:hypothetical protein
MKLRSALVITVALLALSDTGRVVAVPSAMSHEMSGTVQRINRKTITILRTGASKPVVFAWNSKETQFVRNGTPTTIESLPVSMAVHRKQHLRGKAEAKASARTEFQGKRASPVYAGARFFCL